MIFLFVFLAIRFHLVLRTVPLNPRYGAAIRMLYTTYAVLLLITIRIVVRLIEYSSGLVSTLPDHEVYMYILDSLPMLVALVALNVVTSTWEFCGRYDSV